MRTREKVLWGLAVAVFLIGTIGCEFVKPDSPKWIFWPVAVCGGVFLLAEVIGAFFIWVIFLVATNLELRSERPEVVEEDS